jgi:His-Xaa-Ser system protein HxsD
MKQTFSIEVDRQIYNDTVISKAIYWHTANFVINRVVNRNTETITFHAKGNSFSENEIEKVLTKFNQDLNDYKLRQIITEETKDVRTILYIKAFANNDNFEEYD